MHTMYDVHVHIYTKNVGTVVAAVGRKFALLRSKLAEGWNIELPAKLKKDGSDPGRHRTGLGMGYAKKQMKPQEWVKVQKAIGIGIDSLFALRLQILKESKNKSKTRASKSKKEPVVGGQTSELDATTPARENPRTLPCGLAVPLDSTATLPMSDDATCAQIAREKLSALGRAPRTPATPDSCLNVSAASFTPRTLLPPRVSSDTAPLSSSSLSNTPSPSSTHSPVPVALPTSDRAVAIGDVFLDSDNEDVLMTVQQITSSGHITTSTTFLCVEASAGTLAFAASMRATLWKPERVQRKVRHFQSSSHHQRLIPQRSYSEELTHRMLRRVPVLSTFLAPKRLSGGPYTKRSVGTLILR